MTDAGQRMWLPPHLSAAFRPILRKTRADPGEPYLAEVTASNFGHQALGSAALMLASTDLSSSSTARSPIETIPTGLTPSTTGRRRRALFRIKLIASLTGRSALIVTSS